MLNALLYTIPFLISGMLLGVYFVDSDFYLTYVLSGLNREAQVVETLTFFGALFASLVLFKNTRLLFKMGKEFRLSALFVFTIALAIFFFAGEEASWGQSYFYWTTPESYDTIAQKALKGILF